MALDRSSGTEQARGSNPTRIPVGTRKVLDGRGVASRGWTGLDSLRTAVTKIGKGLLRIKVNVLKREADIKWRNNVVRKW
jgi:hypothetical protein